MKYLCVFLLYATTQRKMKWYNYNQFLHTFTFQKYYTKLQKKPQRKQT